MGFEWSLHVVVEDSKPFKLLREELRFTPDTVKVSVNKKSNTQLF